MISTEPGGADSAPGSLAARAAALALDLGVGLGLCLVTTLLAWLWLLLFSGAGVRQPPDRAIDAALAIGLLWLPSWSVITVIGWSRAGQSPGFAAMSLCLSDATGRPPSPLRACVRLVLVAICTLALLLTPLLGVGALAAAAQGTLPRALAIGIGAFALLAAADPACCLISRDRRALHDWLAGTRVLGAG